MQKSKEKGMKSSFCMDYKQEYLIVHPTEKK